MSTVLELLLLDGTTHGEVTRRVRMAAAWLGGLDDDDRETIYNFTNMLYAAGSGYRHGGTAYRLYRGTMQPSVKRRLDVLTAYRLLRRLLAHGLAVAASGVSIADLCDRAQRSDAARTELAELIAEQYRALATAPAPFDSDGISNYRALRCERWPQSTRCRHQPPARLQADGHDDRRQSNMRGAGQRDARLDVWVAPSLGLAVTVWEHKFDHPEDLLECLMTSSADGRPSGKLAT